MYSNYELLYGSIQFPLLEGKVLYLGVTNGRKAKHIKFLEKEQVSFLKTKQYTSTYQATGLHIHSVA
jgi:hypothetical protein